MHVLSHFSPQQKGKSTINAERESETNNNNNEQIVRESKDGYRTILVKTATDVIYKVFPDIESTAKEGLTRVIESCAELDPSDGLSQVVDLDKYLEVLLEEFHLRCNTLSNKFIRVLEDNVSAPLPDNILLYDEFYICMNYFQYGISESEVMAMYREILDSSSLNSVDINTIVEVVRKRNYFCWKIYSSKIDKTIIDYYLLRFMEILWETTKLDLQEKMKKMQLDGNILPKVTVLMHERVKNFQMALSSGTGRGTLSCYRQLLVQLFFSSKKQNRIVGGEFIQEEKTESPETSPPPSP